MGATAAASATPPLCAPAPPAPPLYWEAGPLSAAYDWRSFPNRVKVIKRVLALPLLDIQAFAWLDPRRALASGGVGGFGGRRRNSGQRQQPPRLFLASDDSWDSTSGGIDDDDDYSARLREDGYEDGRGGSSADPHSHRLHERRRQQQQQQQQQQLARRPRPGPVLVGDSSGKRGASSPQWFGCGVLCRDRILKGLITVDPASRTLDYSKALPVSVVGGAALVLGASWRLDGLPIVPGQPAWRPALRVGLTTAIRGGGGRDKGGRGGDGEGAGDTTRASATIRGSPLGSIHVRQTAFLDRRLGVEVVGDVSARLRPAAARRASAAAFAGVGMGGVLGDGGEEEAAIAGRGTIPLSPEFFDSVCLHADVSEVNLVWRL
jgi:hypothetical protein